MSLFLWGKGLFLFEILIDNFKIISLDLSEVTNKAYNY